MSEKNGNDCIFCKIVDGSLSSTKIYEDDKCIAFNDLKPQAPVHILLIPKDHFDSMAKMNAADIELAGHLMITAAQLAHNKGFSESGYRVVINTNSDGGQTVFHLHLHLLAGRQFTFPPG